MEDDSELHKKVDSVIAKVYPALVQIHVVTVVYTAGREQKFQAAGSGAIISPDGYVITNHHVAGKAKLIRCRLSNMEEIDATLVGTDPLADIAIVKLDLTQRKDKEKLAVAEFGDSDSLRVGDRVMAMGCPYAVSQSVSLGIISNTQMMMPKLFWPWTFKLDGEEIGTLVNWIGHDAQIFPGNSGGPLVNTDGKIVGINEISLGLGGAIPSNLARQVAEQIIEKGHVMRSYTGIECQPLLQNYTSDEGVLVSAVMKNSPAEAAGVKPGDVLLDYDGKGVNVRYAEQLPDFNRRMFLTRIGSNVSMKVQRGDQQLNLTLTTTQAEPARGEEHEVSAWGVTARQLTTASAQELKRDSKAGAFVWSVRPGGPAGESKPGLESGDVIVAVNDTAISGLSHLEELTAALTRDQKTPVSALVTFERKGERLMTVVKLGNKDDDEESGEVKKAWLPATYQVLSEDLAKALKLKAAGGVRLTNVFAKSPADEAGLKAGDILTQLDGAAIPCTQPEEIEALDQLLRQYKVGTEVEFTMLRAPEYVQSIVKLKLIARPKPDDQVKKYKDTNFDFEVRDVTYMDRIKNQWPEDQAGALVTASEPGGLAALAHLGLNDLVLAADNTPVPNVKALKSFMADVAANKPRHVSLFVLRGVHTMYIELEPTWRADGKAAKPAAPPEGK